MNTKMNSNTPTPETDTFFKQHHLVPDIEDFARKLERERDEARLKAADRNEWQDVAMKVSAERDRLRKVCDSQDEMIKWYVKEFGLPRWGFEFDKLKNIQKLYNQLPHVKEKTK